MDFTLMFSDTHFQDSSSVDTWAHDPLKCLSRVLVCWSTELPKTSIKNIRVNPLKLNKILFHRGQNHLLIVQFLLSYICCSCYKM